MPRTSDIYAAPPGTPGVSNQPILSNAYNAFVADLVDDLNAIRPVIAGGTGVATYAELRSALDLDAGDDVSFGNLTLTSDDAAADFDPILILYRNSSTPAANDKLGQILFNGKDSGGSLTTYADIFTEIEDATAGTEDSSFSIRTLIASVLTSRIYIDDTSITMTGHTSITGTLTTSGTITANNGGLTLTSTDAGASALPLITMYRNSASPAAADRIGQLLWQGEDSAGNTEDYATLTAVIVDPTTTSEDAQIQLSMAYAGTLDEAYLFGMGSLRLGPGSGAVAALVYREEATGSLTLSGGSGAANGGLVNLFGGSHATKAGDIELVSGATTRLGYDLSADVWNFSTGIAFGSVAAAAANNLTDHLDLYGGVYGITVSSSTLNFVSASAHAWYSGATQRMVLSSAGALTCDSDITAFSDERLKENFVDIDPEYAHALVMTARTQTYNRVDNQPKKRRAGLIAQDWAYTPIVTPFEGDADSDHDGDLTMDYNGALAYAMAAIKHLTNRIERGGL